MESITCQKIIASNRICLTEPVRKILNAKEGDFINFIFDEQGHIVLKKVEA